MAYKSSTAALKVRRLLTTSYRKGRRRLTYFRRRHRRIIKEAVDVISSLPDDILQHILSFIPTRFAIRTSLLSKRWRHVWCDTPSLSFDMLEKADSINKTLSYYTSPKITNFHLSTRSDPHIERWIKLAISRKVENLSLVIWGHINNYTFPDSFYNISSIKELTITLNFTAVNPNYSVSWPSLKKLSLRNCRVSDESMSNILSGCPLLESLTLYFSDKMLVLDLSKSLHLKTLEVNRDTWAPGPVQILAPHLHHLRWINSELPCTLVDVSSLTEAKIDISFVSREGNYKVDILQEMVLKVLEKLKNVENLTFGINFLQILSLAEVCGVPFPMLKVKALTLVTYSWTTFQYPGIERLLQNSPCLKKLLIVPKSDFTKSVPIPMKYLDNYLTMKGVNPDQCWSPKFKGFWNDFRWDSRSKEAAGPHGIIDFVILLENCLQKW